MLEAEMIYVLLLAFCFGENNFDDLRIWTDQSGKFTLKAKLIENKKGVVILEKENGGRIRVSLENLSNDDQKYLRQLTKLKYSKRKNQTKASGSPEGDQPTKTDQSVVSTTEWPTWRGPGRTGVSTETGLLKKWPEGGPELLWTADGLGGGMSSVAVADGKIFTLGNLNDRQSMVCLSTSGKSLWQTPFAGSGEPNSTPTYDDGMVYGISRDGTLACFKAEDGQLVWSVDFKSTFGGRMMSQWGFSESPLVDGDQLVCTPGGERAMIVSLDKKTGKVIWKTPMKSGGSRGQDGAGYSSIVIGNAGGVKQYVTLVGRGVIAVEAKTGKPLWQYERVANGTANVPTPIVQDDLVFCSSGYNDGGSALLQLRKQGNRFAVRELYYFEAREFQNHHGGMVLIDDHVYMGHGHNKGFPVCLELKTGKIKWGRQQRGAGDGSAAIVAADGQVYFRYEDGTMALVEANPMAYKLNGRFRLPIKNGKSWPHPVITDGKLLIRCQNQLACFELKAKP